MFRFMSDTLPRECFVKARLVRIACAVALIPTLLGACAHSDAVSPTPQVSSAPPAIGSVEVTPSVQWPQAGYVASARVSTDDKRLSVHWRSNGGTAATQDVTLAYYPTAMSYLSGGKVAVAGKGDLGATVVEVFEFQEPTLMATDGSGAIILAGYGVTTIKLALRESVVGRDIVMRMCTHPVEDSVVILQYWDSRDVYTLDLRDNALTLAASSTSGAAAPHIPELTGYFGGMWASRHVTNGSVLVLTPLQPDGEAVVLVDASSDGVFDSGSALDGEQWVSLGYADPDNYIH